MPRLCRAALSSAGGLGAATYAAEALMIAVLRERPPDRKGGYELQVREVQVEAETYEVAQKQVADQVPEGWQVVSHRVLRDGL